MIKSNRMGLAGHLAHMGGRKGMGCHRRRLVDTIEIDLREIRWFGMDWRRPHFITSKFSWNEQKFGHGYQRGTKPIKTVLEGKMFLFSIVCIPALGLAHRME
jgi:hypothetical protein